MHSPVNTRSSRSSFVTLVLAVTLGLGCTAGGTTGCLTPFAAGTRYAGPKSDNAINLRLWPEASTT